MNQILLQSGVSSFFRQYVFSLPLFFASLPILSVFSSNALVPVTLIAGVTIALFDFYNHRSVPIPSRRTIVLTILFFGWAFSSWFWSINPEGTLKVTSRLLGLSICGWLLVQAVDRRTQVVKDRIAKYLLWGVIISSVLLVIEAQFSAPITKFAKGIPLDTALNLSRFNRGTTFIAVVGWLLIALNTAKLSNKVLFSFVSASLCLVIWLAHSGSTMIGVVFAVIWIVFFVSFGWRSRYLLLFIVSLSILGMPAIATFTKPFGAAENGYGIYHSAHHRFYIWGFVTDQVLRAPIIGAGMDSSRIYPNLKEQTYKRIRSEEEGGGVIEVEGRVIVLHPHNGPLQIWLELGLIGAILSVFCIWSTYCWGGHYNIQSRRQEAAVQAAIVTAITVVTLGYGVWQNKWFVMFFLFSSILTLLPGRTETGKIEDSYLDK